MLRVIIQLIAQIICGFFKRLVLDTTPETPWYQEPGQSLLSSTDYVKETLTAGGWQCSCGRANFPYVTTCTCGMNKRGNRSSLMQARRQHRQHQQELAKKIRECHLLYESHFITQEESEDMMEKLMCFSFE